MLVVFGLLVGAMVKGATLTVAVVGLQDDLRYHQRRLEHHYAGHPSGRALDGARVAALEAEPEMEALGHKLIVKPYLAANAQEIPQLMAQLRSAKVRHVLLDLPDGALVAAVAASQDGRDPNILFNVASPSDALRGAQCEVNLLHTYPSQSMQFDGLVQYLVGRSWTQALVLAGQRPEDKALQDAFGRSAKRYGLKITKTLPFKLSSDPRERDLANVRLLTNDRNHDVVAVLDSDGEFARGVPFNTQLARPVVGSSGLTPMAWHPQWELNGGPQVSRRFQRLALRPMESQDWAAWAAVKALVSVLSERRLNRLLNPALSAGLPSFLTKGAGMFSGMMLSQYTADTLIVEQRMLCTPASVASIPAAADQEDFVSMGMNTALKNAQIIENACGVLGIEMMAAAQALDLRDFTPGRGTAAAKACVREHIAFLEIDRPLHPDHTAMRELVRSHRVLTTVEQVVGNLAQG